MKERKHALIVEIRGRYAAAMSESGTFVRVKNADYEPGQTVLLATTEPALQKRARFTAFASIAAGFLLLLFGGFTGYVTPAGVVSLDVNPSIEYSINFFDRVLDVTAVNDDGGEILENMDERALLYRPVDEAVEATIMQLRESGYLADDTENDVLLSASSYNVNHAEQLAERMSERVKKQGDLTVYSVSVTKEDVSNAHTLQTSAGKFYLIEQLGESIGESEPFDPKDWVGKSVREIIAETKERPDWQHNKNGATDPDSKKTPKIINEDETGTKNGAEPSGGGQSGSTSPGGAGGSAREPGGSNPSGGGNNP